MKHEFEPQQLATDGSEKVPYLEVNIFPSYHADNLYDMIQWIKILLPLFQKRGILY